MFGRARNHNARAKNATKSAAAKPPFTMRSLWLQVGWGLAAVAAVFVAVLSTRDELAMQRVAALLASFGLTPLQTPQQFNAEAAARQLAQAVHVLADDRDRLANRLAALERDIDDMTGSIKKQIEAVKAAKSEPPPWPDDAPPTPMTPADIAAMIKQATPPETTGVLSPSPSSPAGAGSPNASSPSLPSPSQTVAATAPDAPNIQTAAASPSSAEAAAPAAAAPAAPYGADIATAATMKTLRARWAWLRAAHPAIFDGLRPLVSVKQNGRTSRTELHLVVGPYASAEAAMQFCDFVIPYHLTCQPAMFDGSRLALQ